jgi:hypothetical protein
MLSGLKRFLILAFFLPKPVFDVKPGRVCLAALVVRSGLGGAFVWSDESCPQPGVKLLLGYLATGIYRHI